MGVITVITSGKGGVGKSTLSAALGTALSKRGKRVLLIDGDAGLSSLDYMLGITETMVYHIADVAAGLTEPAKAVYPCAWSPGLFLMPAPQREDDLVSPEVMRQLLYTLARFYDHVLVDCPAGIGMGFQSAAAAAQRALVVSTPDPICLRDCAKTRIALEQAGVAQQRLVVNRFNTKRFRESSAFPDLDSVIDASGIRLIAIVPEDSLFAAMLGTGREPPARSEGNLAAGRLAARLEGERVPLVLHKF